MIGAALPPAARTATEAALGALLEEEARPLRPDARRIRPRGIGFGAPHRPAAYFGALGGAAEAFVKIIPKGGCHSAAELRAQIAYVARQGEPDAVEIHGAAALGMEGALSAQEIEETISAWALGWTGEARRGQTLHLVVSFPRGTDPEKAFAAGKDLGHAAFGSGDFGDVWDHLVALHVDRAHPHVHLIVNRRGLDHGRQLQTYPASPLNPDQLRGLQVEAAARQGIALTATARLARGVFDLAPAPRDWRRAMTRGLAAKPRTRTERALAVARDRMAAHAAAWRGLGRSFREMGDERRARLLEEAARFSGEGRRIMPREVFAETGAWGSLEEARGRVLASIEAAEGRLSRIEDPGKRAAFERALGEHKGRAAKFAPERPDLAPFAEGATLGLWRSAAREARAAAGVGARPALVGAEAEIAERAREIGVDPGAFLARYALGGALDAGTEARWAALELWQVLQMRARDPVGVTPDVQRAAARTLDGLHRAARVAFDKAARARELNPPEIDRERMATALRAAQDALAALRADGRPPHALRRAEAAFADAVARALSPDQKARLAEGDHRVFGEVGLGPDRALDALRSHQAWSNGSGRDAADRRRSGSRDDERGR